MAADHIALPNPSSMVLNASLEAKIKHCSSIAWSMASRYVSSHHELGCLLSIHTDASALFSLMDTSLKSAKLPTLIKALVPFSPKLVSLTS